MKFSKEHKAQAYEYLSKLLKPGDVVYTVGVHPEGNQHIVLIPITRHDGTKGIRDITASVAALIGCRRTARGPIVLGGCGYSKGGHIVSNLGYALWPQGTPEPHGIRNGKPDRDGGFALKHEVL